MQGIFAKKEEKSRARNLCKTAKRRSLRRDIDKSPRMRYNKVHPLIRERPNYMKISSLFRHFALVARHRHKVLIHCAKCGILWRGLVHDLSKFSPAEFFESAAFFQGNRSPIHACREERGFSLAWLHHKGRNKHHPEYWLDADCKVQPLMPYPYAVECVCDKLAATKTYAGENYRPDMPLLHWRRYGSRVDCNPRTKRFIETVFLDLIERGEKFVLNRRYMRETYDRVCLSPSGEEQAQEEEV